MKRLVLGFLLTFAVISGAFATLQHYQAGNRLINGSQLNLMVDVVNGLTGNGTAGPVTGTTGSFTGSLLSSSPSGGIGYKAGSGCAVTQATSRTTGVTCTGTTGAITLVSAAGSATAATFTVTDTSIAATDTVIINQKSGTDLYEIFVTNVAAGSFNVTSFTTGGTTTEQPVFNFAIVKGSAN